jgi:hypothetical protein
LQISLIEDLFQVQTNVFRLVNPNLYLRTPLLATVAAYCWLIPIATIYRPGALVVGLESSTLETHYNVSVFHQKSLPKNGRMNTIAYILGPQLSGVVTFPEAAQNESILDACRFLGSSLVYSITYATQIADLSIRSSSSLQYITGSSLITGEIAGLDHPSSENSSYSLELWGTILDCETKNRSMRKLIADSDDPSGVMIKPNVWIVPTYSISGSRSSNDPKFVLTNTTITYRIAKEVSHFQYYPCMGASINNAAEFRANVASGSISLPATGIHVLIPYTETICRPRIVKYKVVVTHAGGFQNVSYSTIDGGPVPEYSANYHSFNGSFEQFVQFSDAIAVHTEFATNLNVSLSSVDEWELQYPNASETAEAYTLDDGFVVQTCLLRPSSWTKTSTEINKTGPPEIWPLSVFQHRLVANKDYSEIAPKFDPEMAKELLVNTTY